MATVLTNWGFPASVFQPLRYSLSRYDELATLGEPLRTKAELCKAAAFLGRMAVGRFEAWDAIDPIPGSVLARLNLRACHEFVEQARANLEQIGSGGESPAGNREDGSVHAAQGQIGYVSLSSRRGDFLPDIIATSGWTLERLDPECLAMDRCIIVNCIEVPAKRLVPYLGSGLFADTRLIVTDRRHRDEYKSLGNVMSVPMSYDALRTACEALHRAQLAKDERAMDQKTDPMEIPLDLGLAPSSAASG
jgi:hypothetical protein